MMKVLKLEVVNFAPIFIAMKRKKLEIDFTCSKHRLIMLVGGNGTGKTTICSLLHPFAYNGDIDNRTNDIIMEDMDGYKAITIEDCSKIYNIEHFYKRAKDGSIVVKSYIKLDGEELNPNGNVSSFKLLVLNYLGIDESYIKLTRLGQNTINIINMDSSNRKEFMSKRLSVLNEFGKLYKKTSEDLRTIKALMNINVNNMNRLNIQDIDVFTEEILELSYRRDSILKRVDSANKEINILLGKKLALTNNDIEGFYNTINTLVQSKNEINSSIELESKKLVNIDTSLKLSDVLKEYDDIYSEYQIVMSDLNTLYNRRDALKLIIKSSKSAKFINGLKKHKAELERDIISHEAIYGDETNIRVSSEDLKKALSTMQVIENNASYIYTLPKEDLKKMVEESDGDILQYISDVKFEASKVLNKDKIGKLRKLVTKDIYSAYIIAEPDCGYNNCGYREFYHDLCDINTSTDDSVTYDRISEYLENLMYVKSFKSMIDSNMSILNKVPGNELDFWKIMERLIDGDSMIPESTLSSLISMTEDIENYIVMLQDLNKLNEEIKSFNEVDNIDEYIQECFEKDSMIEETEILQKSIKQKLDDITAIKNSLMESQDVMDSIKQQKISLTQIDKELERYQSTVSELATIDDSITELSSNLSLLETVLKDLNSKVEDGNRRIAEYKKLKNERYLLNKDYEDWSLVVDSTATKKGISLEFMNVYLESIRVIANECLEIVYGDRLFISSMHTDEKTFEIKYTKDGIEIGDVRSASQGESSFINIALSFAFLTQDSGQYNIIVLDEIDGVLDIDKKSVFIDILYNRLNAMGCEQCFLISHNDVYNNLGLDIISTDGDADLSKYDSANVIYSN